MGITGFLFIRHGKTQGNLEGRYIGGLNEPLCPQGILEAQALAQKGALPGISDLFSGPALRCRQTAKLLFPHTQYKLCSMKEIDFGIFKGKNAFDLLENDAYKAWLETNCTGPIPGGESTAVFKKRCCEEFEGIANKSKEGITAMVIHGGNIMSIMESFARPKRDFYYYHVPNCGFFLCRYEKGFLTIEEKGGAL